METIRTVDLSELRARVARAEYVVDVDAVADAIIRRALAGRGEPSVPSAPPVREAGDAGHAGDPAAA